MQLIVTFIVLAILLLLGSCLKSKSWVESAKDRTNRLKTWKSDCWRDYEYRERDPYCPNSGKYLDIFLIFMDEESRKPFLNKRCYGACSSDCPKYVCSGHGKCVGTNECKCEPGYAGLSCWKDLTKDPRFNNHCSFRLGGLYGGTCTYWIDKINEFEELQLCAKNKSLTQFMNPLDVIISRMELLNKNKDEKPNCFNSLSCTSCYPDCKDTHMCGHGKCVETDTCKCEEGYFGIQCSKTFDFSDPEIKSYCYEDKTSERCTGWINVMEKLQARDMKERRLAGGYGCTVTELRERKGLCREEWNITARNVMRGVGENMNENEVGIRTMMNLELDQLEGRMRDSMNQKINWLERNIKGDFEYYVKKKKQNN